MTPSVIENQSSTDSAKQAQPIPSDPLLTPEKPPKNPRFKLALAGVLLAAAAAVALGTSLPMFKNLAGGVGGFGSDRADGNFYSAPKERDAKAPVADLPPLDGLNAPQAPAAGIADKGAAQTTQAPASANQMADALGKDQLDSELKTKAAAGQGATNPALPPLMGFADLDHGYNAPAYLIKQASLQLEVGNIQDSFGKIAALTEKYHGYIVESGMNNYESRQPSATLSLKLPSDKLSAALAELDGLGTVRSQQIKTEDLWLRIKQQALEVEHLQGNAKATEPGASRREQDYRIKRQQLERLRLEQMLKMATVSLNLAERAPFWDLRPLGEELRGMSFASLQASVRMLANALQFLPPLLIFLGLAWLGWKLLRQVLIARLSLLSERSLAAVYVSALVFFPICAIGPQALGPVLLFSLLMGAGWAARTLYGWLKNRRQAAPAQTLAGESPTV